MPDAGMFYLPSRERQRKEGTGKRRRGWKERVGGGEGASGQ
jgi:hypothetical protein